MSEPIPVRMPDPSADRPLLLPDEYFTEEDVDLVARALWQQLKDTDFPNLSGAPTKACYEDGRAMLTALAAAGRLLPPVAVVVKPSEGSTDAPSA